MIYGLLSVYKSLGLKCLDVRCTDFKEQSRFVTCKLGLKPGHWIQVMVLEM